MLKKFTPRMGFILMILVGLLSTDRLSPYPWNPMSPALPTEETAIPDGLRNDPTVANRCKNIYDWVCHRKDETGDPTGTVVSDVSGERLTLALFQQILKSHPDWNSDEVNDELIHQIYNPRRRTRFQNTFKWVREAILRFIEKQTALSGDQKVKLKALLQRVELQLPPPADVYADEPDLITKDEVYYERTREGHVRLRVGGAYLLMAKSWFNIVYTLAHELAHSIDPCEAKFYDYHFEAYDRIRSCFISTGLVAHNKNRSECESHDQLSETFSDWVAVHITAEALSLFATEFDAVQILNAARNSVRDLCLQDDDNYELDIEFHPPPQIRIEKIFGGNPEIRYILGCSEPESASDVPLSKLTEYCTFDSVSEPFTKPTPSLRKNKK